MRYKVSQELFVIHFDYTSLRNQESQLMAADFHLPLTFNIKEMPSAINLERLIVTEHHKVPWDQDPEGKKECDGYLLTDSTGVVFANQYPKACYGQVSDTADYRFNTHYADDEDHTAILRAYTKGEKKIYEYHLLSDVICGMNTRIDIIDRNLSKEGEVSPSNSPFFKEIKDQLLDVLSQIKKEFREKYPEYDYEIKERDISINSPDRHFIIKECVFKRIGK